MVICLSFGLASPFQAGKTFHDSYLGKSIHHGICEHLAFRRKRYVRHGSASELFLKTVRSLGSAAKVFIRSLSNKYVAFAFISLVFVASYVLVPIMWKYIFTALISYLAATLFMRYMLDKGIFRARHSREGSISEGHRFMIFVFVVIAATIFSDWLAGYISALYLLYPGDRITLVAFQTIAVLGLVFLDLEFKI